MSTPTPLPPAQQRPNGLRYDCRTMLKSSVGPESLSYIIQRRRRRLENQENNKPPQNRRREHYRCASAVDFDLEKLASPDNLFAAYQLLKTYGGKGAGIDGIRFDEVSNAEVFDSLRQCSRAVLAKSYRPRETRPVPTPKPGGGTRTLQLHCIFDRCLAKALQLAFAPIADSNLPRMNQGVLQLFKEMERDIRRHQTFWLASDDVRKCFDEACIDDVMRCLREHISQPDLLWLIETMMRGNEGPSRQVGLDQGSPWSPTAMEWTLRAVLDVLLDSDTSNPWLLYRYVDNLLILCNDPQSGTQALAQCRDLLQRSSLTLKGEDPPPFDLRDVSHGHVVLGLIPRWENDQLRFRIPDEAYGKLRQNLNKARLGVNPLDKSISVVGGFASAYGPAMTAAEIPSIRENLLGLLIETGHWEYPVDCLGELLASGYQNWIDLPVSGVPVSTGDPR